jgi:hypothetical protein
MYLKRTASCFSIMLASMKYSNGWTKEHLDAYYLASTDVIIDQRDEPG